MKCDVATVKIGDLVKLTKQNDFKVYELTDVAIWEKSELIKTIEMTEVKLPYDPSDKEKQTHKTKLSKAKIKLRHRDRILIKTKHDIATYSVYVGSEYQNDKKVGKVFFTKLMNPSGRCR